jgi:hypothetical protein
VPCSHICFVFGAVGFIENYGRRFASWKYAYPRQHHFITRTSIKITFYLEDLSGFFMGVVVKISKKKPVSVSGLPFSIPLFFQLNRGKSPKPANDATREK